MARKAAPRTTTSQSKSERPNLRLLHEAVYLFTSAERHLVSRYKQARGALSPGRFQALNVLLREQEAPAGQLAREAGLRANSITTMLDQLERNGMVVRRQDVDDRRVWWISLTDKGRTEVAEHQAAWDAAFDDAFADTSDRDLAIACRVLERLTNVFGAFEPPPR